MTRIILLLLPLLAHASVPRIITADILKSSDLTQSYTISYATLNALSGTNTGDITLGAFGSSPNSFGLSLLGQVINLEPADATHPGGLAAADFVSFSERLRYLGAWDDAVDYVVNDEVVYSGIVYICIANNHSGVPVEQPTLWTPAFTLSFPIVAPESAVGAPSYAFNESGNDTGFGSPSDGVIEVSNNNALTATFDASHNLTVTGNLAAANYPFTGNALSVAGYDASGNQISIPGWNYTVNNGMNFYSATPVPADAGVVFNSENNHNLDITLPQSTAQYNTVGFTWNSSFDPANSGNNFTGEYFATTVNDEVQGSGTFGQHHAARIDQDLGNNSAGTFGDSGLTQEHSHIYPSVTVNSFDYDYHSLENDGTVTNNSRMIWFDVSGTGHLKDVDSFIGGELNNTIHVDHDLQFLSFYNSAAVGHDFGVMNVGNDGAITGDMNLFNVGNNTGGGGGGGTIGGNLSLFNFYNSANAIAGDFQGGTVSNQGDVGGSQTGLNIDLSGAAPNGANGININMSSIVSSHQLQGLNINGASLEVQSNLDTSVQTLSGEFQQNDIGGNLTVAAGHPLSGVFGFGNNLGISAVFNDDMGPDGIGIGLGFSVNGFVNQVSVASGKTVDYMNWMTAGAGVPSSPGDGGTLTNVNMFNALGFLNEGGSLFVTNMAGFRASPILCAVASNCWGIRIEDTAADNWLSKDLVIGGTTGLPAANNGLEVQGGAGAAFTGGAQLTTTGSQPACDAAHRGLMWNIDSGTGVADLFQVCQKTVLDTYAWTTH